MLREYGVPGGFDLTDDLHTIEVDFDLSERQTAFYDELLKWYYTTAQPFLTERAPQTLAALDNDAARLHRILQQPKDITVCFLGHSGIGKSTLLNCIAANADQILPSGGIGPLTAQATEVFHSRLCQFSIKYHERKLLWRTCFVLEGELRRAEGKAATGDAAGEIPNDIDPDVAELGDSAADGDDTLLGTLKRQATQVIAGDQFAERSLAYLVDGLRMACGVAQAWGAEITDEDAVRIRRVQLALGRAEAGEAYERRASDGTDEFKRDLHDHAAGFLAPLISEIKVGWPSEVLDAGIRLVDLPGVGIAQDTYRRVTRNYIRDKARAVILVVDRSGPTADAVELLRTSGYWDRLVGSADDPNADPCLLLLAVTKVDDVASEEYRNAAVRSDGARLKKREIYASLAEQFKDKMRRQVADQLGAIGSSSNDAVNEARDAARNRILNELEVYPVSAPEFRKLLLDDEDDRPFLPTREATGVPGLQDRLRQLAENERSLRARQITDVADRLRADTLSEIERLEAVWLERSYAADEAAKLKSDLALAMEPKRKERDLRVGAFREFLEATAQGRIRELVREAREVAEAEIKEYLRRLHNLHWATLRAAVRRGGIYMGNRRVDLPDGIASRFQEPTAAVWSVKLLKEIRNRTQQFASDQASLVEELCEWAESRTESETAKIVRTQQKRIKRRAEQMQDIGKDAVADLRKVVKQALSDAIEPPIREKCNKFVMERRDIGTGVKSRILELFDNLAITATKAAETPATKILKENFSAVRDEIRNAFDGWGDPLEDTANLILERYTEKLSVGDASRRESALEAISDVRAAIPTVR